MILSVMIFVSGSSLYKKCPPEGNVVVEVSKAVCVSLLLTKDAFKNHDTKSLLFTLIVLWFLSSYIFVSFVD